MGGRDHVGGKTKAEKEEGREARRGGVGRARLGAGAHLQCLLDQVASVGGISERQRVFRASSSSRKAYQWAQARPHCVCQQLHLLRRARSSFTTMVPRMCALNTLTKRLHNDAGVLACC